MALHTVVVASVVVAKDDEVGMAEKACSIDVLQKSKVCIVNLDL